MPGLKAQRFSLRDPEPGDLAYVASRQARLYAEEYGWDNSFEALVLEITANFINDFDPEKERCWIAEIDDEIVGSVFIVNQDNSTAKLRLLYVEESARGLGLGRSLVDACISFSRDKGYKHIELWTNDVLSAAIKLYRDAGFQLIREERHRSFGHDLIGQFWVRDL